MLSVPRSLLLATLVAAALPAAATAADVTVSPSDSDVAAKVAAAGAGDTVTFKTGTYSLTLTNGNGNVTLKGEPGAVIAAPASATGSTPTVAFTATSGGADVIQGLVVSNNVTTGPALSGGSAGLNVLDSIVAGGKGDGASFGGGTNLVQRSQILSLLKTGTGATVSSASGDAAKTITLDSTVLVGAKSLSASYAGPVTLAGAGITVNARHVTAIGEVVADSSTAPTLGASPIAVTFTDSIVRGKRTATTAAGSAAATVTATSRDDASDSLADIFTLFVAPAAFNYHLRADAAAVMGKGQTTAGESDKDLDGDARAPGGVSDLGADQFVNKAPTAALKGPTGTVRQTFPATFDASGSADPEARYGGGIASYHWNFGDGQTADTATATTTHAFAGKQTYTVTVTVTDKQGASSAVSAPVSVTVLDGVPPAVTIGKPAQKQKVKLYRTKKGKHGKVVHTKQRVAVTFLGGATDDVGVGRVVLALRPAGLTKGKCRWFDGKTSLKTADCTAPILLEASFLGGGWRYSLPLKAKLPPGPYVLVVAAVDSSGLAGPVRAVTFRLT